MEYRNLGRSGLRVSPLCLGTMMFGGATDEAQSARITARAREQGVLTVGVTPEALAAWHPPKTGRRGRSPQYGEIAIETGHLLRLVFGRPWRQTEGLP